VFKKKVLRRIYGSEREEGAGWKSLHKEELHDLYATTNIIRVMMSRRVRWAGHIARMGEMRNAYSILVVKPEEKRPLGRPRRRQEDNIITDLREISLEVVYWIHLAQNRDQWRAPMNKVMNIRFNKQFRG
jgi:hypothetical protein